MTPPDILMIIAPQNYRDEELDVPRAAFQAQGWHVDVVSTEIGRASGMLGGSEPITRTLADVRPERYEAAAVVGGMGAMSHLWRNETLHALLRQIDAQGGVVSAICLSPAALALAGLLEGKRATVWETPESLGALQQGGASFTGDPVTVDGRIITANGPDAAAAFADAVIAQVRARAAV